MMHWLLSHPFVFPAVVAVVCFVALFRLGDLLLPRPPPPREKQRLFKILPGGRR